MRPLAVLALALSSVLAAAPAVADWNAFHNDERNSGYCACPAYQVYHDLWWGKRLSPATQVDASPVVAGGIVVVASWDFTVRALDSQSGVELWNRTMTASIEGTPAIDNGRVFVLDTAGALHAFNLQTGTLLRSATVGATYGSPTIHEGKIFIGNEAGTLAAYDTETLTPLWQFSDAGNLAGTAIPVPGTKTGATQCDTTPPVPAGAIRGAPAVFDGKVYFGSLNHYVYAVDELGNPDKTTTPEWIFKTGDAVFASPTVDVTNNRIVIGSYDEKVYSLLAAPSGEGPIDASPSPGTNTVCGTLVNTPTWTYDVSSSIGDSKVQSTAATDGTRIYFGSNNGNITAVDAGTGALDWAFHTSGAVKSSPAVANGVVVVGSDGGDVYWLTA
ncbi:MAG: outer membrane protein assembly factor BamB family protein, partial [Thermoplasmatota archaeon]